MGFFEAAKEGIKVVAPGLSLGKILSEVGNELVQQTQHGAHEMAAAIFGGSSYVMYPRAEHDDNQPAIQAPETPAIDEHTRGGRSM